MGQQALAQGRYSTKLVEGEKQAPFLLADARMSQGLAKPVHWCKSIGDGPCALFGYKT